MDYLTTLNAPQQAAVQHETGPLLIIAGAGSGKTRVLTYRIAYLINQCGVPPYRILAVTFTNKAAQEMKERVASIVGLPGKQAWVSTFHATCVQILRFDADKIGYKRNFQIFDTSDQQVVIKDCLKELNLDPKKIEPKAILGSISNAKNELQSPQAFREKASEFWDKQVAKVYQKYQGKLYENNAFDFDDLIMSTVDLLEKNADVLEKYQERFQYIMVDEYQDTNHAQYRLVKLLANKHKNLCVVGDDDQSIYAFRGADIRNILQFEQDYPQAKVVKLEENYRSTQNILDAANQVIKNNQERKGKNLWTSQGSGDKIYFFQGVDERHEAAFISDTISQSYRDDSRSYSDFTILYRTHAQSRIIEEEFVRRGIPYRIVSGLRFYDRKEIKDILAYLRLIHNPSDNYSLRRIINVPKRGIGDTTVAKLADYANAHGISLLEALADLDKMPNIRGKYQSALQQFLALIQSLRVSQETSSITLLVEKILTASGYKEFLNNQRTVEAESRIENVNEFLTVTKQFEKADDSSSLEIFLEKIALMSDIDNYDQDAPMVTMMTLHAAKGLEFPVVFLVGMEEEVFPSSRSLWEPGQIEEERRLAYVGFTRAKQQLYLTCARCRMIFGSFSENPVSTFVKEIPEDLLEDISVTQRKPEMATLRVHPKANTPAKESRTIQDKATPRQATDLFRVGDKVRHEKWGDGMVVSISGDKQDMISVAFPNQDIKKILVGYAPISKI